MPLYVLKIKCDLENIARIAHSGETLWKFNIESESGERRDGITFSSSEELELDGSKGTANFVMKWDRSSSHHAYIKIIAVKKVSGSYLAENAGSFLTVLGLECRGLVPTAWIPGQDFKAESVSGKQFDVDLTDGDWADYDEDGDMSVSITNLEHRIERA